MVLAGGSAQAQSATRKPRVLTREAPDRGRLDLSYALSMMTERQTTGRVDVLIEGKAPSPLKLSAAWFFGRTGLGLAADVAFERFTLTGQDFSGQSATLQFTGRNLSGGLAGRWVADSGLVAEAEIGWGFGELPLVQSSTSSLESVAMYHHGPLLAGSFGYDPGGRLSVRASGRYLPVALGGTPDNNPLQKVTGGAEVALKLFAVGSTRWAALAGYELSWISMTGTSYVSQTIHRGGLGLRVGFADPEPIVIELPPPTGPGWIVGRVVGDDTRGPVRGADVEIPGVGSLKADLAGGFRVEKAGPGKVVVKARASGYRGAEAAVDVPAEDEASVTVTLHKPVGPGVIKGLVRLAPDAKNPEARTPVPRIAVQVAGFGTVETDAEGKFSVPKAGPGLVTLNIDAKGYRKAEEVVSVPPEGEATVDLIVVKLGARALATVRGLVRSVTGAPVAATLRIPEMRIRSRAAADGSFSFRLPGGSYTVAIEADGFISQAKVVEVADGDQAIFNVDMHPLKR